MRIQRLLFACIPALLLVLVACSQAQHSSDGLNRGPAAVASTSDSSVDFAANAFPPVLPNDTVHGLGPVDSWQSESCLSCHKNGKNNAPKVVHEGMADVLMMGKCRTCHTSTEE